MSTVTFVIAVAVAISVGTVGAYALILKLIGTKKGKKVLKDATKEMTDLTFDLLKEMKEDTKKWEELMFN